MRTRLAAMLCAAAFVASPGIAAATTFNLRASIDGGYYVSGTLSIDTATGLVTGESGTLYRNGIALSVFGAPTGQGPFTPGGGIAPSYLFPSFGTNGYLFVGAVPSTSLIGYGGGELCARVAASNCAFSDLFKSGAAVGDVFQGALLPTSDTIETYLLTGTFANGDNVTGTVVIDTTAGYVLDEHATLFSHGVVVDEFFHPLSQSVFAPGGGISPSYLLQSIGRGGVLLNLGVPGTSLVGYPGGDLCATGNGLTCAFSDIFLTSTISSDAITARLAKPTAVPEPSMIPLLGLGLLAAGLGRVRRRV